MTHLDHASSDTSFSLRLVRVLEIHEFIASHRLGARFDAIAEHATRRYGTSPRTTRRDLAAMQLVGIVDGRKDGNAVRFFSRTNV